MRHFDLLNFQHILLWLIPTVLFIIVFAVGLGYMHLHGRDSEQRKSRIIYRYPGDIEDRDAPFPLVMMLIVAGTVAWVFFYMVFIGLSPIKI